MRKKFEGYSAPLEFSKGEPFDKESQRPLTVKDAGKEFAWNKLSPEEQSFYMRIWNRERSSGSPNAKDLTEYDRLQSFLKREQDSFVAKANDKRYTLEMAAEEERAAGLELALEQLTQEDREIFARLDEGTFSDRFHGPESDEYKRIHARLNEL